MNIQNLRPMEKSPYFFQNLKIKLKVYTPAAAAMGANRSILRFVVVVVVVVLFRILFSRLSSRRCFHGVLQSCGRKRTLLSRSFLLVKALKSCDRERPSKCRKAWNPVRSFPVSTLHFMTHGKSAVQSFSKTMLMNSSDYSRHSCTRSF